MNSAMSSTVRAIGPVRPSQDQALISDGIGMTAWDGRKPTMLQKDAGIRSEPPMSLPSPIACTREPTTAATPPLLPPALRAGAYGLVVVPKTSLNVWEPAPNSGTFVFPVLTTPAALSRAMIRSSLVGTKALSTTEPWVVRIPAVLLVSLWVRGRPCRGGSSAPE